MLRGILVAALGWTAALASPALAQAPGQEAPPAPSAVVRKNKAPVSDEVLRVKLPRPQEADLSNGLHLIVLEDRRVPLVSFRLLIPGAGGYFDPGDMVGLASFTAAMMREGTAGHTSQQISEQLETMAASLSITAWASSVEATMSGSSLAGHFERLLDLTADVLLNPSFPAEELARYKQRTQAQLIQQRANPGFLANEMYARVVYGEHPAARVAPSPDALQRVTRDDLAGFHRSRYVPDHAVIAVAGDISLAEARNLIEAKLGAWKKAGVPAPAVTDPPPAGPRKVYLVARPDSVQTNLVVGTQAIERIHPDYDVLSVMNKVLGGGPTGRLFLVLREEKSYTYGAGSTLDAGRHRGDWSASTSVRTEVTDPALRDLLAEIARMRDQPVPQREYDDARRSMVASFALSLESPERMLGYYLTQWIYKLPADYWDRYPERIMAVTKDQVQAAASKYLDPDRLLIVAVGDAAKIQPVLAEYGELELYDTEGRRAPAGDLGRIDELVRAEMTRQKIPGLALAVVRDGRVVKAQGYGEANVEHRVPVAPETIFQSGSVGKQFTAAGVMLLAAEGRLALDDPLTKCFPDAPARWRGITIRHLLTHTSGLPDYTAGTLDFRRDYTEEELLRFAYDLKLEFEPGARWNYSNTGYVVLGAAIRKASGQFYGDLLRDRVFKPLGMTTARVISEEDIVPNRAAGYRLVDRALKNQEWVAPSLNTTADGALYFSLRDLIAWDRGISEGRVLDAGAWGRVFTPVTLNSGNAYPYGFGWVVDAVNGHRVQRHGGSWQGFRSTIVRYPDRRLTIIVLANLAQADPDETADRVAALVDPALERPEPTPIDDDDAALQARVRRLLADAGARRLSPDEFGYVRAGFFPDGAARIAELLADAGPLQQLTLLERRRLGDDTMSLYELAFARKKLRLRIAVAPDGKLAAFDLREPPPPGPA